MALALCLACLTARANADESCLNEWATFRADVVEHDWRLVEITGLDAVRFVASYNAMPPKSDLHADTVVVMTIPDAPFKGVVFVRKGCIAELGFVPTAIIEKLLTDIPGDPA